MRLPLPFPLYRFGCEILPKRVFGAPPFWSGRASETATTTALKRKSTSTAEDEFRWHPSFAMPTLSTEKVFWLHGYRTMIVIILVNRTIHPPIHPQPFPNPHGGAPSLRKAAALICAVNRFFLRKQDALSRFPPFVIVHACPSLPIH